MFCSHCGSKLNDGMEFCFKCGAKVGQSSKAPQAVEPSTKPPVAEAPAIDLAAEPIAEPIAEPAADQPAEPPIAPPMTPPPAAPDAYAKPKKQRVYQKTSAGTKMLSIMLVIVMVIFGLLGVTVATVRLTLTRSHVRDAYRDGELADLQIVDDGEIKTLAMWVQDLGSDTTDYVRVDIPTAKRFLSQDYINEFIEKALLDFSGFLLDGNKPKVLKMDSIRDFYTTLNDDLKRKIGQFFSEEEKEEFLQSVREGELSFLNLGDTDAFEQAYGFSLKLFQTLLSRWMMCVYLGIALICLVLLIVINRRNLPAAFGYDGWTLTIFGGVFVLLALTTLIFTWVKGNFFVTKMMRFLALYMGVIGLSLLAVGVILLLIRRALKAHSIVEEPSFE